MSDSKPKRKKRKQKQRLLPEEAGDDADGIANPILTGEESDTGLVYSGGETSGGETAEDIEEAENLAQDLKTKHAQKQRELSEVVSPKDDLAKELRSVKKKSKEKVEETIRQEQEESAGEDTTTLQTATEVADDGTLPMPEGEETGEGIPTLGDGEEEDDETKIKKLKKKKKTEESEITPLTQEEEKEEDKDKKEEEEKKEEPEPAPPKPEEETKTPKGKTLKDRLKNRLQKAKETAVSEVQEKEREERREKRLKRDQQVTRFDTEIT